jgi:glutamine kinase
MKYPQSKARILDALSCQLEKFQIPDLIYFTVENWRKNEKEIVENINQKFSETKLAIRSSAADEDKINNSGAGQYESILDVTSTDSENIRSAVESVIKSYKRSVDFNASDEILIQAMMHETVMSGVVFTHDLNSGAPYYVINYDDITGLTNTVTSGEGEHANRTLYVHRGAIESLRSERFRNLLSAIQELEEVIGSKFLDIEFVLDSNLAPFLLQVRNITTQPNWNRAIAKRIDSSLNSIHSFVKTRFKPINEIYGDTTVLGQMPDWNPAEMIGRAPRALAFSLYKTLITDNAWRIARDKMGYAVPAGQPLMLSLAGQPYIDTRLSFHSFLPQKLSSEISKKLVNTWVTNLREKPELHDKIEFDVAITTYSFDINDKIQKLIPGVLNKDEQSEYKQALKNQLCNLLHEYNEGSITNSLNQLEELSSKQMLLKPGMNQACLNSLMRMIDECIQYGTVPFSILARHGFIARTLLFSLERLGILTTSDIEKLQSGIRTIASEIVDDMQRLQLGELEQEEFMSRYGHLRPGTYDILSLRYDQVKDIFLNDISVIKKETTPLFSLTRHQQKTINELIKIEELPWGSADKLFDYIQEATASREYGKFIFTKSVSDILEVIAAYGEYHGLSRDEMSHVPVNNLLEIASSVTEGNIEDRIRAIANRGVEEHAVCSAIRLPQVLFDEAGIHVIPFQVSHPNFITHKIISAQSVQLRTHEAPPVLVGKIVLIENADPGYDWIFAHSVAGLITKYGGANSHMAIRCAEFGIPAAIGCGEQQFEVLTKVDHILLNCSASVIQTI